KISILEQGKVTGECLAQRARVLPGRQLVMKYLPLAKPLGDMESLQGYDVYDVEAVGGKTRMTFQTFQQYGTTRMTQEKFREYGKEMEGDGEKQWQEKFIPALKALLAKKA